MDFSVLDEDLDGFILNPYAGRDEEGNWISGYTSVDFLNANFGQFSTATLMKEATTCIGLQMFFNDLVSQGKLAA
jgi:hypothetical protein